ncbi:hypothetical protein BGZ89_005725 [Linnemannia elongata]|nr:hypothetical protein BGZ89_005725 [Linnemannia elongata]
MKILSLIPLVLALGNLVKGETINSGIIPGTDIEVYGLIDTKTGLPVDLRKVSKNFLAIPNMGEDPGSNSQKKREEDLTHVLSKRGDGFDEREWVRKFCIPQVSVNPEANPYHQDLTGDKLVNFFTGTGRPIAYPSSGVDCRLSGQDCPITLTKDITFTNAIVLTVSDSQGNSLTDTLGKTESVTNSSSISDTVAKTVEKNWSHTDSKTKDYSLTTTTGDITTQGNSSNTNNVLIKTKGEEGGNSTTIGKEDGTSESHEISGSGGLNILGIINVSASGGKTDGKTHSDSRSDTNNLNTSHQDGWNNSTMKEDNYSKQTQNLRAETNGHSETSSDTTGGSESTTNSRMSTKGIDISVSKEKSSSNSTNVDHTVAQGNTTTTASSAGLSRGWYVPKGKCMALACFPTSEMLIMPYLCADTEEQSVERVAVALSKFSTKEQEANCQFAGLITCAEAQRGNMPFVTYDDTFLSITPTNSIRMGQSITSQTPLVSTNGDYVAIVEANGNFVVYGPGGVVKWQTGATPFVYIKDFNRYAHRARINMRGHLVVETMNMFSKVKYQPDLYKQVWSTQPVTHNFTVGTPRRASSPVDGYILTLGDDAILTLYDAMYIPIWTSFQEGKNRANYRGYRFQEYYQVPTDSPTPDPGLGPVKDPHNSIVFPTVFPADKDYLDSKDANCTDGIASGTGIQSPNKRFKVILYPSGNMVIKDGTRTMYSSLTANMDYTVAPYQMILTPNGELVIQDATRKWIWGTTNNVKGSVGPYMAMIEDQGRLVVIDANGKEVWEHWPMGGKNTAYLVHIPTRVCYDTCNECATTVNATASVTNTITLPPVTVSTTMTTATTTTLLPTNTPAPNPESILNKCKAWMDQYKIDPFVNWGGIEKNTQMQAQWIYYDCACFGTYLKYGVEILRTHLGKWGKLTDTAIRKEYTNSYCNCPLAQDVYKITPNPKNWGSLTDTARQAQWTKDGCDANVNREPFVTNAIGGTPVTPKWTTVLNMTTGVYDNYFTTFTNTTGTTIGFNSTTGADKKVTSTIATTFLTNATMAVTDSQTISITTGYTVMTVPSVTTTVPPVVTTTTTTKTTTPTQAPGCTGGKPGVGDGSGTTGQCCKTEADCKDSCNGVMCGVCGTNFTC